jgi:hypothetical protein
MIYARKDEWVTCENGHRLGRFTRDMSVGDGITSDLLTAPVIAPEGEVVGPCACGAWFAFTTKDSDDVWFHFEEGWRYGHGPKFWSFPRLSGMQLPPDGPQTALPDQFQLFAESVGDNGDGDSSSSPQLKQGERSADEISDVTPHTTTLCGASAEAVSAAPFTNNWERARAYRDLANDLASIRECPTGQVVAAFYLHHRDLLVDLLNAEHRRLAKSVDEHFFKSRRADWHYDSDGYCDNPGRGY